MIETITYYTSNWQTGEEQEHTYELPVKKVKVRDIFDAIKQNGFEHLRGQWLDYRDGKPVGGCVLGQAGINLSTIAPADTEGADLYDELEPIRSVDNDDGELLDGVLSFSIEAQLNRFKNSVAKWNEGQRDDACGDLIIYWNDATDPNNKGEWFLPTYEDVVNMCYEILSPHFEEEVTLINF